MNVTGADRNALCIISHDENRCGNITFTSSVNDKAQCCDHWAFVVIAPSALLLRDPFNWPINATGQRTLRHCGQSEWVTPDIVFGN